MKRKWSRPKYHANCNWYKCSRNHPKIEFTVAIVGRPATGTRCRYCICPLCSILEGDLTVVKGWGGLIKSYNEEVVRILNMGGLNVVFETMIHPPAWRITAEEITPEEMYMDEGSDLRCDGGEYE